MKDSLIKIVIADDHPIVVEGVQSWLTETNPIRVVGMAHSFQELMSLLPKVHADVVVLDLHGMQAGPILMARRLRRIHPNLAIVVFTSAIDLIPELLAAGVLGYVVKEEQEIELLNAISAAHVGKQYLSPIAATHLAQRTQPINQQDLSKREHQILTLLSQGLGTEEMASQLDLDPRSVQNYITSLRRKTGCTERIQLVDWYRRTSTEQSDHTRIIVNRLNNN